MIEYFKEDKDKHRVLFVSNKLEIFLPERYKKYGCLSIEEHVVALAIFDMVINDKIYTGMFLPAIVRIEPSSVEPISIGTEQYYKLTLNKGDLFITTRIVKNPALAYAAFNENIYLGRMPDFLKYDKAPWIFDDMMEVCGMNFGVDHALFEILFAFLYRSKKDPNKQHRHTDMKDDPNFISLSHSPTLATSTMSKMLGSYFDDALDSALMVNKSDEPTELDEIQLK